MEARLIVDEPARGSWNMALDEALLLSAERSGQSTLRLYRWAEPTLSLGYFQSARQRDEHLPSRSCPLVRRSTGGGAILHDRELTYSFTTPVPQGRRGDTQRFYDVFHRTLVEQFLSRGIVCRLCDEQTSQSQVGEPFLCFQRRAVGDVLLGTAKVVGSAQRRRHGAVLQHGSILLATSPHAPELPGLEQLTGQALEGQDWLRGWLQRLEEQLTIRWVRGTATAEERAEAEQLDRQKYAQVTWTAKK